MTIMNRFKKTSMLAFLLSIPMVYAASFTDSLEGPMTALLELLSLSFIVESSYISATKAAIFLILFSVVFATLNFGLSGGKGKGVIDTGDDKQNKKISGTVAFAFAAISVIFIPDTIVQAIGEMYSGIVALLLLGLPTGIITGVVFYYTKDMDDSRALKHSLRGFALLLISVLISTIYEEYLFTNSLNEWLFGLPAGIAGIWAIVELIKAIMRINWGSLGSGLGGRNAGGNQGANNVPNLNTPTGAANPAPQNPQNTIIKTNVIHEDNIQKGKKKWVTVQCSNNAFCQGMQFIFMKGGATSNLSVSGTRNLFRNSVEIEVDASNAANGLYKLNVILTDSNNATYVANRGFELDFNVTPAGNPDDAQITSITDSQGNPAPIQIQKPARGRPTKHNFIILGTKLTNNVEYEILGAPTGSVAIKNIQRFQGNTRVNLEIEIGSSIPENTYHIAPKLVGGQIINQGLEGFEIVSGNAGNASGNLIQGISGTLHQNHTVGTTQGRNPRNIKKHVIEDFKLHGNFSSLIQPQIELIPAPDNAPIQISAGTLQAGFLQAVRQIHFDTSISLTAPIQLILTDQQTGHQEAIHFRLDRISPQGQQTGGGNQGGGNQQQQPDRQLADLIAFIQNETHAFERTKTAVNWIRHGNRIKQELEHFLNSLNQQRVVNLFTNQQDAQNMVLIPTLLKIYATFLGTPQEAGYVDLQNTVHNRDFGKIIRRINNFLLYCDRSLNHLSGNNMTQFFRLLKIRWPKLIDYISHILQNSQNTNQSQSPFSGMNFGGSYNRYPGP